MNTRKRIILLLIVLAGLFAVSLAAAAALQQTGPTPAPSVGISCPTPDETAVPICAPGAPASATPGSAPGLLGTPAGP